MVQWLACWTINHVVRFSNPVNADILRVLIHVFPSDSNYKVKTLTVDCRWQYQAAREEICPHLPRLRK